MNCGRGRAALDFCGAYKFCRGFKQRNGGVYCSGLHSSLDTPEELLRDPDSESERSRNTRSVVLRTSCIRRAIGSISCARPSVEIVLAGALIAEDAEKSNLKSTARTANLRWQHSNAYHSKKGQRKCARVGCYYLGRDLRNGVLLCAEHDTLEGAAVGEPGDAPHPVAHGVGAEAARAPPSATRRGSPKPRRAVRFGTDSRRGPEAPAEPRRSARCTILPLPIRPPFG